MLYIYRNCKNYVLNARYLHCNIYNLVTVLVLHVVLHVHGFA